MRTTDFSGKFIVRAAYWFALAMLWHYTIRNPDGAVEIQIQLRVQATATGLRQYSYPAVLVPFGVGVSGKYGCKYYSGFAILTLKRTNQTMKRISMT